MNLNKKNIEALTDEQILNLLLPAINKIKEKYSYIQINQEEFYNLMLLEIKVSREDYKGDILYDEYMSKKINKIIKKYIQNSLSDESKANIIINGFLQNNLKKPQNVNNAMKNLNIISSFLKKYNYIPNVNILINMIENNPYLSDSIRLVVKKYERQFNLDVLTEVIDDTLIITFIEVYCMLNKIDVKHFENVDENIDLGFETSDSLIIYLKEINMYPTLTYEEELFLAQRIAEGDEKAKKRFIECNLKLVVSLAKKYVGRGLPMLDLIQEGNFGLMLAVERFDASKGFKFSTYAVHWINRSINFALSRKSKIVRFPAYYYDASKNYRKTEMALEEKLERKPTISEIAEEMGITVSKAITIYKSQNEVISLNSFVDNTEKELEKFIASGEESIEEQIVKKAIPVDVRKLLKDCNLSERQMDILAYRFGLDGREILTLEEIGKKYNLTRERIRQIEVSALMKLRKSIHIKSLAEYTGRPNESMQNIYEFIRQSNEEKTQKSLRDRERKGSTKVVSEIKPVDKIHEFVSVKMLELSDNAKFQQITNTLTSKEIIVFVLMLGKTNTEKFTTKEMTRYLDITFDEFLILTKRVLNMYRNEIEKFLNESNISEENKVKQKKVIK